MPRFKQRLIHPGVCQGISTMLILALLCSACAARSAPALFDAGELALQLPALSSLRSVSLVDNIQAGADAVSHHPEVGQKVNSLLLEPNTGSGFEWAIWAFGPVAEAPEDVLVSLGLNNEGAGPLFLLLANFQRGSWDVAQVVNPDSQQDVQITVDPALHFSPDGRVLLAAAYQGGSTSGVVINTVNFRQPGEPPLNAVINADVSSGDVPLSLTLDASASTGNIVGFEWDTAGSGNFLTDTGTTPTLDTGYSSPGVFNATVRVTDDTGSTDTASIQISATQNGNLPPVAILLPDVTEGDGEAGFTVNLVSEASEDPDGTISLFEWDLDGDTSTGTDGFEVSDTTAQNQQSGINAPGEVRLRLRVTDNDGLSSSVTAVIVSHGWVQVPVATLPAGKLASGFSLGSVGKFPVMSYVSGATNLLEFVRSSSKLGLDPADWKLTDISGGRLGKPTSIIDVASRPAIAYSGLDDFLTYARSNTADGGQQSEWELVTVDSVDSLGMSLALVDAKPGISYVERNNLGNVRLKFAFSSTDTGIDAADWDSLTVKAVDAQIQSIGGFSMLHLAEGRPAIAWQSIVDSLDAKRFVHYARSTTANGSQAADWQQTLGISECSDRGVSAGIVDGRPAIGYSSASPAADTASFLHSSSTSGASLADWASVKIGASGEGGFNTELAVIDGLPLMSYSLDTVQDSALGLRLAESSSPDGALVTDWLNQDSATAANQMKDNSTDHDLAVLSGYPALVFFDQTAGKVVYSIRF